jgi:hypothetical protein
MPGAVLDLSDPLAKVILPPISGLTQVNSDWHAVNGPSQILNKPMLGTAAYRSESDFDPIGAAQAAAASITAVSLGLGPTSHPALAGLTLTGALAANGGITSSYSGGALINASGATTSFQIGAIASSGASLYWGVESSTGGSVATGTSAYASVFGSKNATAVQFFTNSVLALTIDSARNVTAGVAGSANANNFLSIAGSDNVTGYGPYLNISDGTGTIANIGSSSCVIVDGARNLALTASHAMKFATNGYTGIALTLDVSQNATFAGWVETAAPAGGSGAATFKGGKILSGAFTIDLTHAYEVEIGGVLKRLAVLN